MMAAIFLVWWFADGGRRLNRRVEIPETDGSLLDLIGMLWPWIAVFLFLALP